MCSMEIRRVVVCRDVEETGWWYLERKILQSFCCLQNITDLSCLPIVFVGVNTCFGCSFVCLPSIVVVVAFCWFS